MAVQRYEFHFANVQNVFGNLWNLWKLYLKMVKSFSYYKLEKQVDRRRLFFKFITLQKF